MQSWGSSTVAVWTGIINVTVVVTLTLVSIRSTRASARHCSSVRVGSSPCMRWARSSIAAQQAADSAAGSEATQLVSPGTWEG